MKTLIIGGVAGGATAAARLRRLDEHGDIIMFESGEYISFANCGLPYYIGGEIKEKSSLTLQTPKSFKARFNIDVRILSEVVSINPKEKKISVKNIKTGDEYEETYDKLVLSMGAASIKPNIIGFDSNKVFTLRNIPDTYKIKDYININESKAAIVVGGGFIGLEMAENLMMLGLDVTLIEALDQVIAPIDPEMAADVHNYIRHKGINLILNNKVLEINDDKLKLHVKLENGEIEGDILISAIGVTPETKLAKEAGITCNIKGSIVVDKNMQTNIDNIYAVGDAVEITDFITNEKGFVPLAGPANKQGRIAANNLFYGNTSEYKNTQGSSIVKIFDMAVASTGINEKTAIRLSLDYDKVYTYSANHATYYPKAVNMSIKTIYEKKSGRILGVQIVGFDGVDKRCDVFATAIRAKMTAFDLTELELCYAPPFGSAKDPVNMAGYVIENVLKGNVKNFHYNQVNSLPRDGSVILLDTRTEIEYKNGHIDGFINIPLDSIRERIQELDKLKKVYIHCHSGLRSYIASRILTQNGFDCYNLSGGYRLYTSVYGQRQSVKAAVKEEKPQKTILLDACSLQCPGPIMQLSTALNTAVSGDVIEISTTDTSFANEIEAFCNKTGNIFLGMENKKGVCLAKIKKGIYQE